MTYARGLLNYKISKNAERWIMGTNYGLKRHLKNQEEYTKPVSDDNPLVIKMQDKLIAMQKLLWHLEKGHTNENVELINFIEDIKKTELFHSVEFQDTYKVLKEFGLHI